ncbi:MAG: translocation/assembly module TamB domain-containing protein [Silicimonas sp.]|nr:translocation/assembly module TamB domain-containing protein [Silicimonas sp.]
MRRLFCILLLCATPVFAQDDGSPGFFDRLFGTDEADSDAEQGTLLERLIEDSLSGEGRSVTVTGFRGALAGKATLESLTIADAEGTWLTLTDATLDWSRAALFRGALRVTELTAREILLPRLATPAEAEAPTPEAGRFRLPELPVSIEIGRIAAERVEIGEAVFGVASELSLEGSLSLSGGNGDADLAITRLDRQGEITLDAAFRNATEDLRIDLTMREGEGGILATLAGLPGAPPVDFTVSGDAPLSEFAADIRLATDGEDRLEGQVTVGDTEDARRILANIAGDIAPVFAPEYRDFFGNRLALQLEALVYRDGRLHLPAFSLTARELSLNGSVEIGSDGLPERLDIAGEVAPEGGDRVLLPLAGEATEVSRANLSVRFDAAQSEDWLARFEIADLDRGGLSAASLDLTATGRIASGAAQTVSGDIAFNVTGLATGDGLGEALGADLDGRAAIAWEGGPLNIERFELTGRDLTASGNAVIDAGEIRANAALFADRIANFSTIAGRDLSGEATLEASGAFNPLTGAFDVTARGTTTDLQIGDDRADAVLAGEARLDVTATRDTDGLKIGLTTLESAAAQLTGEASLRSGGSALILKGRLAETEIVLPGLTGPSEVSFSGQEDERRNWTIAAELSAPAVTAAVQGLVTDIYRTPAFQGTTTADISDLSVFSQLARRPLSGQLRLDAEGGANADLTRALIDGTLSGRDISVGDADLDRLLAGAVSLTVKGARTDDRIDIEGFSLDSETLTADVSGVLTDITGNPAFEGRVNARSGDLSMFSGLAQRQLSGQLSLAAEGALNADLTTARLEATANGQDLATGMAALDPILKGPISLEIAGERTGNSARIDKLILDSQSLAANVTGTISELDGTPAFDGQIAAESPDLAAFSGLAKRPLTGQLSLTATGNANADLSQARLDAEAQGTGLSIGMAAADRLLSGPVRLVLRAGRNGERIEIETVDFSSDTLTAETSGQLGSEGGELAVLARLADIAPFVAGFNGPASVDGTVARSGGRLLLDLAATGPGGTRADVSGTLAETFETADLAIDGTAPLGLANRFIAPRSLAGTAQFDLRLSGPPALSSLSGQVSLTGGRLADPSLAAALEDIAGQITLSGSQAVLAIETRVQTGGRIAVSGPVGLSAPNSAALQVDLLGVRATNPKLFETVANGRIRIDGPLTGGALIAGNIDLGETDIRIPSSGLGGTGAIPEITHLNEPPPVRRTRQKAGLLDSQNGGNGAGGPVYPLDIRVSAPNRIFVRGRGLDSEFGGALRITGSTSDVIPIGAFELIRGRLDILGRRLALETARITIQGGFVPFLNIRATTDAEDTQVNVEVIGPADNPDIRFTSSPELPQEEVLARLIFGRGLETLSPLQAARLALAVRTLAGQGGEGVVGNIRKGAGLADLDVTTNENGNTAVRAGAYLGENIYSDVTVDSAGETEINLNLDVSRSLTVRGGVSNDGESSLGIFFERDY